MSQLRDEKDDSSAPTQKTLDIFFRSSYNNSNVNVTNGPSITDTSEGDDCCVNARTKDEHLIHDAGTDVSMDQQAFFSHDENLVVPEGRGLVNYDNEDASSNPLTCDGLGRTKLDGDTSSWKVHV